MDAINDDTRSRYRDIVSIMAYGRPSIVHFNSNQLVSVFRANTLSDKKDGDNKAVLTVCPNRSVDENIM